MSIVAILGVFLLIHKFKLKKKLTIFKSELWFNMDEEEFLETCLKEFGIMEDWDTFEI